MRKKESHAIPQLNTEQLQHPYFIEVFLFFYLRVRRRQVSSSLVVFAFDWCEMRATLPETASSHHQLIKKRIERKQNASLVR